MEQMRLVTTLIGLALVCSGSGLASANETTKQLPEPSELGLTLQGEWGFQTEDYSFGRCQMSGSLSVFLPKSETSEILPCALSAVEICDNERSVAEQACQIRLEGDTLLIESQVLNMLEVKSWSTGYAPDNFSLDDVTAVKMTGRLVSAVTAPVVFYRLNGGIS